GDEAVDSCLEDEAVDNCLEDKAVDSYLVDENNNKTIEKNSKVEKIVHQLGSVSEKYHYLSNFFPMPTDYDQRKMPDLFIVRSISNHFDIITKINGAMNKTPKDISTKIDFQDNGYKTDDINEDRRKLLKEDVFGLNKLMLSTELPKWKVCETQRIFLAQAFVMMQNYASNPSVAIG
ncbi:21255_t:CDS:2, partial [Gigaspora rosea]